LIGDEVLINISKSISDNLRKDDVFARWGGEEFVILFKDTSIEDAQSKTHRLKDIIENTKHDKVGTVTASFGVTKLKLDEEDQNTIFKRCDEALYRAKSKGRNRVEISL
jgi:diguanylate cyclase (GGDEF)-like protein